MKKKVKFSIYEMNIIKSTLSLFLVQVLIILFFAFAFIDSLPIDSSEINKLILW